MEYDGEITDLQSDDDQDPSLSYRSVEDNYRGAAMNDHYFGLDIPRMKAQHSPDHKQPVFNQVPVIDEFSLAPESPLWVQPFTSFSIQDSFSSILLQCATFMREQQTFIIDYDYAGHCAMRGIIYHSSDKRSATFSLSIFQHPSAQSAQTEKTMHLVEVNRLDGDAIMFRSFYDELEKFLEPADQLAPPQSLDTDPSNWNFAMEPMADVTGLAVDPEALVDSEHLAGIIQLANSPKVDQAREGVALLASCASSPTNQHELLASPFLAPVLQKTLSSRDAETARFASLCLLNLLQQPKQGANELAKTLTSCLVKLLCERERLETLETNRQVATCLLKLAVGGLLVQADLAKLSYPGADPATEAYLSQVRVGVQ